MKRLLTLVAFFATIQASAQQVNPVPDYVFRNQMSVGRGTVTDTAAYFSIGPRYGANKGFMPPIVGDTATFSSGKRNGLLIFSVQKNKFLYWDSVRVQWSDMAGSSGSYITGTGITGYVPQFNGTTTIDTSALFTLGNRLGIGSSTFAYTSTNTANVELNGTAGGIVGFKRNDSARGYLWHTGENMELANTTAGSISFNTNSATRGSISSAGVWRLHNLAGTGDRVVVASSNGTLSASTSVTGLVDTTTISTRAWRQKGIDSVVSIIPAAGVGGSGTTNYIPKFTASSTIGNSQIFDNGTNVGIGTVTPGALLDVNTGAAAGSVLNSIRLSQTGTSANSGQRIQFFNSQQSWEQGALTSLREGANANFSMLFSTAVSGTNTERLRITSGGDVGIGTTSPSVFVHVQKNQNAVTTLRVENTDTTSSGARANISVKNVDVDYHITSIGKTGAGINAAFAGTNSNHTLYLMTNGTARQTIFANGRIGINTTTDAGYQLDINGTLRSVNGANFATNGTSHIGMGVVPSAWSWPNGVTQFRFGGHIAVADNSFLQLGTNSYYDGSNYVRVNAGYSSRYLQNDGGHFWSTSITSTAGSTVTFNEQMRMTRDGELLINTTTDAGDYKLQVAGNIYGSGLAVIGNAIINTNSPFVTGANIYTNGQSLALGTQGANLMSFFTNNAERGRINSAGEWIIDASGTDAGDYKLQVVGNARVGTGKLDIVTNTAFGLSVSRSGTDVVAQQINNSTGILYYGAESSTGGALFTGSSAYAAVIGSGAAYPLQFATDNVTRATINTNGELLINTLTDNGDFKLQVNGSALISGSIQTANPVSGTAVPWRLGSVVATNVQLDTANYVEVNINGTFYRLAIVTPL